MAGAAIAPAIIGGAIGVVGSLSATVLVLTWTGSRDARGTALETAQQVVGVEEQIWSQATGGAQLLGQLRKLGVRLRESGLPEAVRVAFDTVTYNCWLQANARPRDEARIDADLLALQHQVDQVVVSHVLGGGFVLARWKRRRQRDELMRKLKGRDLVAPPWPIPHDVLHRSTRELLDVREEVSGDLAKAGTEEPGDWPVARTIEGVNDPSVH